MDKLVEFLSGLGQAFRDLVALGLMESAEDGPPMKFEDVAQTDPDKVWRAFFVSALLSGVLFTLAGPLAEGKEATLEAGTKIHGAVPAILLGIVTAVVLFIVPVSWMIDVFCWRRPRRWVMLGVWGAALAPAVLATGLGYTLLSLTGRMDAGRDPALVGAVIGAGTLLIGLSVFWGLMRGLVSSRRYLGALVCRKHQGTCPPLCKLWFNIVAWTPPLVVLAGLVKFLTL